jgi:hypothetical protein
MRHAKNTIKLGRKAEQSKFAAGKPGLQPHRVESNQDDLGKGEGGPSLCCKDEYHSANGDLHSRRVAFTLTLKVQGARFNWEKANRRSTRARDALATRTDSRVLTVRFHDPTLVRLEHAAKHHLVQIWEEVYVR